MSSQISAVTITDDVVAAGMGGAVVLRRAGAAPSKHFATLPMPASVLLRHRARSVARIDAALSAAGKQWAALKRRRESLCWPIRKALMRANLATIPLDDPYLASVSVAQEKRVHPARIVRYDGLAKILPVRPTQIVIERKRGKHVPGPCISRAVMPHVCPVCRPQVQPPYFVRHCEAHR